MVFFFTEHQRHVEVHALAKTHHEVSDPVALG